jgi:glycosyltransferase involved in cell wall biosynthesis
MKILLTTKTLEKGGAEVLISSIVPKLMKEGCDVHVLYYQECNSELIGIIVNSGATVEYIGSYDVSSLFSTIYKTFCYINEFKPDVIFEHSPLVSTFTRLVSGKTPIVYLEHSLFFNYNLITRYLNKLTYSLVNKVIFCSKSVSFSHGGRGVILNNAINLNADTNSTSIDFYGYKVIISVANLSKVKNHQMLIQAFEMIKTSKVKLLLVGAPRDNYEHITSLVLNSPKKDDIIIYGASNNVCGLLRKSDVFCLTSIYEGLPLSLLEAMSMGVVPVCTAVGGIPDVIGDDCGFVIKDASSLCEKLDYLLNNPLAYDKLSLSAKLKITKDYDLDNYIKSLLNIFKSLK